MAKQAKIEMPPEVLQWFRDKGRLGGFRTARALTAEQRSAMARKASHIRWGIGEHAEPEKQAAAGGE